jgi:N-acetylglucosaminyl-diphospho-decaprenol L-rhamnosyltransferase
MTPRRRAARGASKGSAGGAVAAVVVNHDAGEALLGCVASLRAAGVEQIVVVDNASSDGSLEALAARDAAVTLLPTGANLGYGRAANRGVARCAAEFVLVCNPDLVVGPEAVKVLLAELDTHPEVAAVGPRILDAAGAVYPSARAFPSYRDAAGHALLGLFLPDNAFSRRYRLAAADPAEEREVDWVSGAFVMVRRVAFDSVGGFDEGYFMYVEDLDLCWRLAQAGWSVRYAPQASVVHLQGLSSARHPYKMLLAHHRSTWRFATHRAEGGEVALLPLVGAGLFARLVVSLARESWLRQSRAGRPD